MGIEFAKHLKESVFSMPVPGDMEMPGKDEKDHRQNKTPAKPAEHTREKLHRVTQRALQSFSFRSLSPHL